MHQAQFGTKNEREKTAFDQINWQTLDLIPEAKKSCTELFAKTREIFRVLSESIERSQSQRKIVRGLEILPHKSYQTKHLNSKLGFLEVRTEQLFQF